MSLMTINFSKFVCHLLMDKCSLDLNSKINLFYFLVGRLGVISIFLNGLLKVSDQND